MGIGECSRNAGNAVAFDLISLVGRIRVPVPHQATTLPVVGTVQLHSQRGLGQRGSCGNHYHILRAAIPQS